ncbi:MAG: hypothetical protein CVU05_12355 [Bacteroidetes bacterium HGW-Bacteroidetes-21]|jgi:hypothetical protein|nr:MAG: hypothetical protein CVU05_12355 [Bacteroidetes bacterium HGW-Bacteroidetes-21]
MQSIIEKNNDFIFLLFKEMEKDNLGYIYRGRFTQEITDNILLLSESKLEKEEQSSKTKKRVYSILVECLQNITRHQDDTGDESHESLGYFVLQKKSDKYYITTGNLIDKNNIDYIEKLIAKVNSLEKEELKAYYKEILEEGHFSQKGGAGLGLIDMAKKSGSKLQYYFRDISDAFSYFYLHTVPTLEEGQDKSLNPQHSLESIVNIHLKLNDNNVLLVFNGLLNQEGLMGILSSLEGQMMGSATLKKKVYYVVVEMLQNIVKHGLNPTQELNANPGIFILAEKDDQYHILTGNFINTSHVNELKTKLDTVNDMSNDQLDQLFNKSLFDFENDNSKKAGLGIIDLKIKSNNQLSYFIHPVNNEYSFFSMECIIHFQ